MRLAGDALDRAVALWPGCLDAWRYMVSVQVLLGDRERALDATTRWRLLERQERPSLWEWLRQRCSSGRAAQQQEQVES